ncbi:MAG: 50S ribosomal protein L32e [Nanoarchaeota archaeon]|mgnify:CR=1 FL=1
MASIKELLDIRKRMKGKKPDFIRQDIRKKARLKIKWRKPRGLDSKIRRKLSGRAKPVSQGYRSPEKVRGLHQSGLQQFIIRAINDMDKLSPKEHCLVISSSLGKKKRVEALKKAREKSFQVVNINAEDYIKKAEEAIISRKRVKQEKEKKQKTEKITKKEEEESGKEDKKEMEKKEKDRLLTKKEI